MLSKGKMDMGSRKGGRSCRMGCCWVRHSMVDKSDAMSFAVWCHFAPSNDPIGLSTWDQWLRLLITTYPMVSMRSSNESSYRFRVPMF